MGNDQRLVPPRISWRVSLALLAVIYWRVWGIGIPLVLTPVAIHMAIELSRTQWGAYLVWLVTGKP